MSLTESYCVYKHTNKENGKIYIGITKQEPQRRWQNGVGYFGTYFGNAIAKYGWDGFHHDIIADRLSKNAACSMEIALIAVYKSNNNEFGYNICEGGQTGDNLTPHFGKTNPRAVSVRRIDPLSGEVVQYETINTAAKEMGINYRGICKSCRGISKTYRGYIWEYMDRDFEKPVRHERGKYEHIKQRKKVSVIDGDGKSYQFDSILQAAAHFGLRANTASRYVSGVRNDPAGRRWFACL